jgi:CRISPR system Cascade subunit CasE
MYLSYLLIDLGNNPDRPRPGRSWLRNRYHVHQRLCMAFPSAIRKADDSDFLKPFKPDEFGNGQVHVKRDADAGFLFRIDPQPNGRAMIVVQSSIEPDWDYAFHNADFLLSATPEVNQYEPSCSLGELYRFRFAANPTRRLSKHSPDAKQESIGKRVPVPPDQLVDWLEHRGQKDGFSINKDSITIQPTYVFMKKSSMEKNSKGQRLYSVLFNGLLRVSDPEAFQQTLVSGIGTAKAFGFGLLSVAPAYAALSGESS